MLYFVYFVLYFYVFVVGICIASFINVVIYRVPRKISIAKGRSFCTTCKTQLKFYDLVPIFSFLFLKGKCRYCGSKISYRYMVVELLGGILSVLSVVVFGITWEALIVFVCAIILMAIAFIDAENMIIPNSLIIALIVPAVLSTFLMPDVTIISRIIGFFCVSIPMLIITLIVSGAFGGGDIKLVAVCGYLLGWKNMLPAIFIAILLGGAYSIYLIAKKKVDKKAHFAFGPFLSIGIIISMLFGNFIVNGYLYFTNNLFL